MYSGVIEIISLAYIFAYTFIPQNSRNGKLHGCRSKLSNTRVGACFIVLISNSRKGLEMRIYKEDVSALDITFLPTVVKRSLSFLTISSYPKDLLAKRSRLYLNKLYKISLYSSPSTFSRWTSFKWIFIHDNIY
jgi:hypothetical protein